MQRAQIWLHLSIVEFILKIAFTWKQTGIEASSEGAAASGPV